MKVIKTSQFIISEYTATEGGTKPQDEKTILAAKDEDQKPEQPDEKNFTQEH